MKECEYCGKPLTKQRTEITTYNPRLVRVYHPECARKAKKRTNSQFTIHLGTWRGV